VVSVAVLAVALLPTPTNVAHAANTGQLRQKISAGKAKISRLSGTVHQASSRLRAMGASIHALERRIAAIQADLNARRTELLKLRDELAAAHARLARLEAFERRAEGVLSKQLVMNYESDQPDLVTVVLEAHGFADLLERLAFAQRIRQQDVQVVKEVKAARTAVTAEATKLGALQVREQNALADVLRQRNSLAQADATLVQQHDQLANFHSDKASELASARGEVASLQHQLSRLLAAQAAAAAAAARARELAAASRQQSSSSGAAAPAPTQVSSGGGFTFPLPRGAASPPGTWSLDSGVDISAPGGTPEVAVCSGTIVLHGIGGFGPWAPVIHCDSPLSGGSYVYYGHAGPANQLPVGTHVSAGQVMSEVGPGIVGISTGPHIEIGFCDSSGTPIGGGTASQMMALLQASYGG
jgi:septal ring factor EnvC (AmiA/AmiB activator)